MAKNSNQQFILILYWIQSIIASLLLATMFFTYARTGHFFRLTEHLYEGIAGSIIGIWLLGAGLAKLTYNVLRKKDQTGSFPEVNIPGRTGSHIRGAMEKIQNMDPNTDAKEKSFKVFRISIIVLGFVAVLGGFIMQCLGISMNL